MLASRAHRMVGARAESRESAPDHRPARPHAERPPPGTRCAGAGTAVVRSCGSAAQRAVRGRRSPHPRRSTRRRRRRSGCRVAARGRRAARPAGHRPAAADDGGGAGRRRRRARTAAAAAAGRTAGRGLAGRRRCPSADPGAGWLAHCAAFASPPGSAGRLRSSGSSARTANTRIAVAVSEAEQAQTEKSTSKVSIHANSVSTQPSAARPTVIQERGKPSFRSVKAGSSAQTVASRNRKNAVLTLPGLPAAQAEAEEVVARSCTRGRS